MGVYPTLLDKEIIMLMYEAGMRKVKLAIESGSERVLKEVMHRNFNLGSIKEIVKECHKYNMHVSGSFVIGMIGETKEEIVETLDFSTAVGLDGVAFETAVPLPGTDFYYEAVEKGYLPASYSFRNAVMADKSILNIPKGSPDFVMHPDELAKMIERKERDFSALRNSSS